MKLLLPVDGSECSLHAVDYAVKLAKENGPVSVQLLNVYDAPVRLGDVGVRLSADEMHKIESQLKSSAFDAAERKLKDAGVPYEHEVLAGDIAPFIARRADESGCDAIVMGTRGHGALADLVIGSVAMKVVRLAKVPVTLVR